MSFKRADLADSIAKHGVVVRVLVAQTKGSVPREAGAAMLFWQGGQSGTVGGGSVEHNAIKQAKDMLENGPQSVRIDQALGPAIDQCCGGHVTLTFEVFDADNLPANDLEIFTRKIGYETYGASKPQVIDTKTPALSDGWLSETMRPQTTPIWIFGAGHVGQALAAVLEPLASFNINLIEFQNDMAGMVAQAPANAKHFIMTKSHRTDLEICDALLKHGFAYAGLIGSKTKWARFRSQLQKMGHSNGEISKIRCPIGIPELGKEPQAIAVGIAHGLLQIRS